MSVTGSEFNDAFFSELAGWQAMKQARAILSENRVTASEWQPPLLRGSVQSGGMTFRSGLVIKSKSDVENICSCRESRRDGIICAHSVAVGLHYIRSAESAEPGKAAQKPTDAVSPVPVSKPAKPARAMRRTAPGQEGEDVEIFLILPPNLPDAIARGKVMLYAEAKWRKGRVPLNALPLDAPFSLDDLDSRLLSQLEALDEGNTPAMLQVSLTQLSHVLTAIAGHPRVTLGKSKPLQVLQEPLRLAVRATLENTGEILLRLRQELRGLIAGEPVSWLLQDDELRPVHLPTGLQELVKRPIRIARAQVPLFLNQSWPVLLREADLEADFSPDDFTLQTVPPRFKLHLAGGIAQLEASLQVSYEGLVTSGSADAWWLPDPDNATCYKTRDLAAEQAATATLARSGFTGPDSRGLYHLKGQTAVLNFFAREFPRLEKEWDVTLEEKLERSTEKNLERITPRFEVTSSGENWFDMAISYGSKEGTQFSPAEIQRLLLSGQSHRRLPNGKFAVMDTGAVEELEQVLIDCAPEQHSGAYRVDTAQTAFVQSTLGHHGDWQVDAPTSWKQRAATQTGQLDLQSPPLGPLESVLRPYQNRGVAWLRFLRANGFGGVLADEMGLGKTVQVLAHLSVLRTSGAVEPKQEGLAHLPSLVVCPSSLVFNWAAEAAKFTPELRVVAMHGPDRKEKFAQIPAQDVVIVSYAVLRRDLEIYRGLEFDTVILDEAQHIKNRQTQNAQAVKAIRSRNRLVLTGTPLENSVLDLWSIFDFLMPGYLGSAQDFKDRYEVPITREKSAAAQDRLGRRIRPFLLRRLKREVATDLPEKIEQISFCELTSEQAGLYQQVLEASRREIVNAVDSGGQAKSRMVALTALLRLRQICCDPRLLKLQKQEQGSAAAQELDERDTPTSGKVALFGELVQEVLDGGHRALIFSQFTSMLALLIQELEAQQLKFCYLDGSTRDRGEVVARFQQDPSIPVFLISLKAGGVGLNLTGADTVIHFDPWWNPAVEAQATDRAHRIGQKRVVTSYKLITRGTVEEKILNLQMRKKSLLNSMLADEEALSASLSWEEIQELFG